MHILMWGKYIGIAEDAFNDTITVEYKVFSVSKFRFGQWIILIFGFNIQIYGAD